MFVLFYEITRYGGLPGAALRNVAVVVHLEPLRSSTTTLTLRVLSAVIHLEALRAFITTLTLRILSVVIDIQALRAFAVNPGGIVCD